MTEKSNEEKVSGLIGHVCKQKFFFDLKWVEKVYFFNNFKEKFLDRSDPSQKVKLVNLNRLFKNGKARLTNKTSVILLKIEGRSVGVVLDEVVRVVHNENFSKIPLTTFPHGHNFLIFDAVIDTKDEKILCFSKNVLCAFAS